MEIVKKEKPIRAITAIKNIGLIIKNVPQAEKKGIADYKGAIEADQEIGATGTVGQAHLGIGIIHAIKRGPQRAKDHLEQAIRIFEKTGACAFLEQARQELDNLTNVSTSTATSRQ